MAIRPPSADRRRDQNHRRHRPRGPWRDEREVQRVGEVARAVRGPEHLDVAEILRALVEECAPVRKRPAADDEQGHEPEEDAGHERGQDEDQRLGTGGWGLGTEG